MRKATEEEAEDIMNKAREWVNTAPNIGMFNDCKSVTRSSVAEYIANQQGVSLWDICND